MGVSTQPAAEFIQHILLKSYFKLNFYRSVVIDSFTIQLVSNASFNGYPNNCLTSFTIFKNTIACFVPKCYKGLVGGKKVSEEKRKILPMHIEPGLYPSNVDIVVAMSNKIRERLGAQAFEYNGIFVSVDKITQKVAVLYLRAN